MHHKFKVIFVDYAVNLDTISVTFYIQVYLMQYQNQGKTDVPND